MASSNATPEAQLQRLRELDRRLTAVTRERDQLASDVEALCLRDGGSMFSRSYVLTERIRSTETELSEERAKTDALATEKEKLSEDLANAQIARQAAATLSAQQGSRLEKLEKDLSYFQARAHGAHAQGPWDTCTGSMGHTRACAWTLPHARMHACMRRRPQRMYASKACVLACRALIACMCVPQGSTCSCVMSMYARYTLYDMCAFPCMSAHTCMPHACMCACAMHVCLCHAC